MVSLFEGGDLGSGLVTLPGALWHMVALEEVGGVAPELPQAPLWLTIDVVFSLHLVSRYRVIGDRGSITEDHWRVSIEVAFGLGHGTCERGEARFRGASHR